MKLFPTSTYGCVCWNSSIFEVIWNLFYAMIASGRLPNCARKGANAAKDHPGEENKMLSVVARGGGVGRDMSHHQVFSPAKGCSAPDLPPGTVPEWEGPLNPPPLPRRELRLWVCAGRTRKELQRCPGFAVPVTVTEERRIVEPEGQPLPSTSCEFNLLLLRAGGIRDVSLRGQKAAPEVRRARRSVLSLSFCDFGLQTKPQGVHRA